MHLCDSMSSVLRLPSLQPVSASASLPVRPPLPLQARARCMRPASTSIRRCRSLCSSPNSTGKGTPLWERMYHFFAFRRDEFLTHYHQRSNVESTFSMIKRKFGDSLRSKTDTAMKNEALCKVLAHNLCCVISAWYELGIEPNEWAAPTDKKEIPADPRASILGLVQ